MNDRRWSVASNRGMESIECELVGNVDRDLVCRFTIIGEYWNRAQERAREVTEDFRVVLPQVILAQEALGELKQSLVDWLEKERAFSTTLQPTNGGGQVLRISLGDDPRFVRSTHKTVLAFSYSSGLVMTSTISFIVDHSCVQMSIQGLADFLRIQE